MKASEIKSLTKTKTLRDAIIILNERLKRRTWTTHCNGKRRTFDPGGIVWEKGYFLLSARWTVEPGVVWYRYARLPIEEACDCITGQFSPEYMRE